ncbi:hypothetical protein SAMN05192546_103131 [Tindallia californiensis]|uniref:Uncharacterized protein n=1 Tax=Tindallia californiensis TaxID=159292 RepID=A0A1H3LA33_9FIRM|nr:hypothetical protein SAMN05192546_103131 [Tindallia californiensis]
MGKYVIIKGKDAGRVMNGTITKHGGSDHEPYRCD